MSLLADLVDSLTNSDRVLADILRTSKVLASRLDVDELGAWISYELSGYTRVADVPDYRKLKIITLGDFRGPFGSSLSNSAIPYLNFPEQYRLQAVSYMETRGVAAIESSLKHDPGDINLEWDPNLTVLLRDHVQVTGGMILVRLHSSLPRDSLVSVLDEVRNRLLGLLLDLEKVNPQAGDRAQVHATPREIVNQIFHNHIYSPGNIAIGSRDFEQRSKSVAKGDASSLIEALQQIGVSQTDITELLLAIEADGEVEKSIGDNVSSWMGRMVQKASSGSWQISVSAAGQVLGTLIGAFLGIGVGAK
jgi:hypothetical protein